MTNNVYGIDLGTCNMKIYCKASNKIMNEKNTIFSYLWPRSKRWMRALKRAFNVPRLKSQIGEYGVLRFRLSYYKIISPPHPIW